MSDRPPEDQAVFDRHPAITQDGLTFDERCDCCEGPGPLRMSADGTASVCASCEMALTAHPPP